VDNSSAADAYADDRAVLSKSSLKVDDLGGVVNRLMEWVKSWKKDGKEAMTAG
jgi:hypothetical protein